MALEFNHFSPQAFERMVQALCIKVLGPGTVIFGPGADGGREATFDGEVPYPSASDRWKGYIVVQCKCRENLRKNKDDADWLSTQLKADLERFTDHKRNLRKPEFYILASNVSLSSHPKTGGKAKIGRIFESYKKKLGLKGFSIWSAEELGAFLQSSEEIRRAYANWLTPSDVLATILAKLERPNLSRLLPLALSRDLRLERDVRLKDAGQETDRPIFLEQVFVDLPLDDDALTIYGHPEAAAGNGAKEHLDIRGAVAHLLSRARNKLDPDSAAIAVKELGPGLPNRIVLLGGPGQGKSTLTQFIAQIERARLINAQKSARINPQTANLINPILKRALEERLDLTGPVRFPIRVDIPGFADALKNAADNKKNQDLITHMAQRLSKEVTVSISGDDLRAWLGTCPSILILDGLDEVPPTANRVSVIRAIDALWDNLHLVEADTLVIVTTRPQGYNQDLDPTYWQHWTLAPLTVPHALKYATRLAEVRSSDLDHQRKVLNEITQASSDLATAPLLTSPLQVAILFGIAFLKGAIPRDRWDLFDRYYMLLRDREAQKPNSLVREYKRQVDALHHEAGFLLHLAAESAGNANAYFTPDQFKEIIERLLSAEGFSKSEMKNISNELRRIATDRLVLLASRVQNRISFDVRSLQEFMAAAQLTAASTVPIGERLRAVASSAHWRHVYRIAVSKIFSVAELGHFRHDILAICHGLDSGDLGDAARLTRAGAKLALELLRDGVAATAPLFCKQLIRRSLALLDLGPEVVDGALIEQFNDGTKDVYREDIVERLRQKTTISAAAAWNLTVLATSSDRAWGERLLFEYWPQDPRDVLQIVAQAKVAEYPPKSRERIHQAQWAVGFTEVVKFSVNMRPYLKQETIKTDGNETIDIVVLPPRYRLRKVRLGQPEMEIEILPETGKSNLSVVISPLVVGDERKANKSFQLPGWEPLRALDEFLQKPSSKSLGKFLRSPCFSGGVSEGLEGLSPWIIETLFHEHRQGVSFEMLANEAEAGAFGDLKDWIDAQSRWRHQGLRKEDFLSWNKGRYISADIAVIGAPSCAYLSLVHGRIDIGWFAALMEIAKQVEQPLKRVRIVDALMFVHHEKAALPAECSEHVVKIVVNLLTEPVVGDHKALWTSFLYLPCEWWPNLVVEKLDAMGRNSEHRLWGNTGIRGLITKFNERPELRGLLALVICRQQDGSGREIDFGVSDIHESAFECRDDDSEIIRASVAMFCLVSGRWAAADMDWMCDVLSGQRIGGKLPAMAEVFRSRRFSDHPLRAQILQRLISAGAVGRYGLVQVLAGDMDARSSGLEESGKRERLGLPSPPRIQ